MTRGCRLSLSVACAALMLLAACPPAPSYAGSQSTSTTGSEAPSSTPDLAPLAPELAVQVRSLVAVRVVLERTQWRHNPPLDGGVIASDVAACNDETWRVFREGWRPFREGGGKDVAAAEGLAPVVVKRATDQLRLCMQARGYTAAPGGALDKVFEKPPGAQDRASQQGGAVQGQPFESKGPADIAAATLPSVAVLEIEDARRQRRQASGFVVRDDLLATNFHVVAGAARISARLVGQPATRAVAVAGIVAADEASDLALVKVPSLGAPVLRLGDDGGLRVGDAVFVVGNPEGLEGTFSTGTVSALRGEGRNRVIQLTAPVSAGSSGAPVLNARGEVVGVVRATMREGQNLNFAVPVSSVKRLLRAGGPVIAFPPARRPPGGAAPAPNVTAPPGDVLGWQSLRWGMTEREVRQLLPSSHKQESPDPSGPERGPLYPAFRFPLTIAGVEYSVTLSFEWRRQSLQQVLFSPLADSQEGGAVFESLRTLLSEKYGSPRRVPVGQCFGTWCRELEWRFPTTTISLSHWAVQIDERDLGFASLRYHPTKAQKADEAREKERL